MEHLEKAKAIKFIKPNSQFVLKGDDLKWLDDNETQPTAAEIEAGWVAYQAAQEAEAQAQASAKAALLERLGITEAEAKLLLA